MMLATLISYADRNTLALLAPTILRETRLSAEQYGLIVSAFSIAYVIGNLLWGGTVLGLALGATLYNPPPPPPPAYVYVPYPPPPVPVYPHYVYADHIAWCTAHYPGYNGVTDTFVGSNGIVYRCVGPY